MALLTSEIQLIKYELGFNELLVGAEPWIGVARVFENVIQPYTQSGASTTSSTTVAAPALPPTQTSLTLAVATGFSVGDRVVIDVDARQEIATVQSISGSTISVLLYGAHSGTYPVTVEGGESIIRGILSKLRAIGGIGAAVGPDGSGLLSEASSTAGIKKVDEIEFFGGAGSGSSFGAQFTAIKQQREYWRDELARALGIGRMNRPSGGGVAMY